MGDDQRRPASTLLDYLRVVRRRKWIIALTVVLVPLAAVLFSLHQKHLYRATAEVLLSNQNLATNTANPQVQGLSQDPQRIAQTQADLARSPTVAKRTIRALGLLRRTPDSLLASSSVSPKSDTDLLEFTVTATKPRLAAQLATEYARQFTIYRRELDTGAIERARKGLQTRISQLEAAGDTHSALHGSLVDREQQLATLAALQSSNTSVVRAANGAAQIQPQPRRNAILGLLLGLLLGVGLVFLREALDTRIRSVDEIGEDLHLPLLARLAEPSKELRTQEKLAMLEEPNGAQAEAFRMLRTNLEFTNLDRGARTIMITSALEAEGKSTTVANLAVALARTGKRVALLDLDLRRPFLHRLFDLGPRAGVTDVALGRTDLVDAIAPITIGGRAGMNRNGKGTENGHASVGGLLEVIVAGTPPPDPGEFFSTGALVDILAQLRERADIVLVDAPPLLHVGDGITLSARVDALLLVTNLKLIRRETLRELNRVLEASPTAILGFVATGAQLEDGYGYRGYYTNEPRAAADATTETIA